MHVHGTHPALGVRVSRDTVMLPLVGASYMALAVGIKFFFFVFCKTVSMLFPNYCTNNWSPIGEERERVYNNVTKQMITYHDLVRRPAHTGPATLRFGWARAFS